MIRIALLLVSLTNLCCAESAYESLAKDLRVYLPEGVTAVIEYKGSEHEQVMIRWEKPFVVYYEVINGPDLPHPKSQIHDPISIRIIPNTNLKEVYAYKAEYFAVKSRLIEWNEKMKSVPGLQAKDFAFGSPEQWLSAWKPRTDAEKQLVAEYEAFVKNEYMLVMAKRRNCPNLIFKERFILLESQLDWGAAVFEPEGVEAIEDMLRTIRARCSGTIERY